MKKLFSILILILLLYVIVPPNLYSFTYVNTVERDYIQIGATSGTPQSVYKILFTGPTVTFSNEVGTVNVAAMGSDITITKADPSIIFNVTTANDTDFWLGVQDDAGGDDDDSFNIGKGTTTGSSIYFKIDKDGNLTNYGNIDFGADDDISTTTIHDAGYITMYDDSDDTSVQIGPVANGTTTLGITGTINPTTLQESGNSVPNSTDNLSFFAATTSAQLAGVLSDETGGTGVAVFGTTPTFTTSINLGADDAICFANIHDAGYIDLYDDSDDTSVRIGPVANGTTILDMTGSFRISGDLYITGDNIFATTNTIGAIWVGDGTNFNPVVMGTDASIAADGAVTVADDSHAHTGSTLSGIDISNDTNLSGDTEIVLTGDVLSIGSAITRDTEWDSITEINAATTDADIIATNSSWTGGDLGGTGLAASVTDDSHAHTGSTLSGIDISADTNLAAGNYLDLTDDTIAFDPTEITGGTTWDDGGEATVAWTWNLSGSDDPVLTLGDGAWNFGDSNVTVKDITATGNASFGPITFGTDGGAISLYSKPVTASDPNNTEESVALGVDGENYLKIYTQSDGAGSVNTPHVVATGAFNYGSDDGIDDDYVITLKLAPQEYVAGLLIVFSVATANTGACTVDVNGLGQKALKSLHDNDPPDNYIEAGSIVMAIYDGTNFQIQTPDANP